MALYTNGHKVCINLSKINLLSVSLPSQTNTGNWTLINADKVGNSTFGTSVGQVGLMFTDQSSSKLNAQQAGLIFRRSPTGVSITGPNWNTTTANIHLYKVSNGNPISASNTMVSGDLLYLIIQLNSKQYIIGFNNNILTYTEVTNITSYSSNDYYQWQCSGSATGFSLRNKNTVTKFLSVTNNGALILLDNDNSLQFYCDGDLLNKRVFSGSDWYIYAKDSTVGARGSFDNYSAFLYTYSVTSKLKSGKLRVTYTLTKVSATATISGQDLFLAVKNSSGNLFVVGRNGNNTIIRSVQPTANEDGTLTISLTNETLSDYYLNCNMSNGNVSLSKNTVFSYYYLSKPSTISESSDLVYDSSSYSFKYSDTYGLYIQNSSSTGDPFGVSSMGSQFPTETKANEANTGTTLIFRQNGSTWSPYYGSLNTGDTYAIAVRKAPEDENHPGNNTASYYLVGTTKKYTWASTAATYLNTGIITSSGETLYTNAICTLIENTDHFYITVDGLYLDVKNYRLFTTPNQPTGEFYLGNNNELKYSYYVSTNTNGTITSQLVETSFGISEISLSLIAHEFATLNDIVVTEDAECTAYEGVYGAGLFYGNQGLNIRDNNLSLETTSLEWYYIPNEQPPDDSRLWSVDERIDYRCALYTNNHRV